MHVCHGVHVEARGLFAVIGSPSTKAQGLNSGHRTWQQVPLPAEPSGQTGLFFNIVLTANKR